MTQRLSQPGRFVGNLMTCSAKPLVRLTADPDVVLGTRMVFPFHLTKTGGKRVYCYRRLK